MKTIKIDSTVNISRKEFLDILKDIPKDSFEICFEYKSDFGVTKHLRDLVGYIFDYYGFSHMWKTRFILIVDELNNNAIEYGSRSGEYNKLRLSIKPTGIKNYKIKIEVEDTGSGVANKTASEMCNLAEKKKKRGFDNYHSIRGRGLFLIIDKMVDKLYFKDSKNGGLVVGLKKEISLDEETSYCAYSSLEEAEETFEKTLEKLDNEEISIDDIDFDKVSNLKLA